MTIGNTTISLVGPSGCVKPGSIKVRVTSHDKRRVSKDRFGFVRRAKILVTFFFLDGGHKVTDRRAAFKARWSTAGLAKGSTHQAAAKVVAQPLRTRGRQHLVGRGFTKVLTTTVKLCS